jgi:hypothetical protein
MPPLDPWGVEVIEPLGARSNTSNSSKPWRRRSETVVARHDRDRDTVLPRFKEQPTILRGIQGWLVMEALLAAPAVGVQGASTSTDLCNKVLAPPLDLVMTTFFRSWPALVARGIGRSRPRGSIWRWQGLSACWCSGAAPSGLSPATSL